MSTNLNSIVEYHGPHDSYSCGYCKSPNTNFSNGIWAHMLTVSDYQDLIDRGWRRSGQYCYKPTIEATCCPMYTIRCRIPEFKLSKSQKKVLKRFNKYLGGEELVENVCGDRKNVSNSEEAIMADNEGYEGGDQFVESNKTPQNIKITDIKNNMDHEEVQDDVKMEKVENALEKQAAESKPAKSGDFKIGLGVDPNKGPCKKAKQIRRERKLEKLKQKGVDVTTLNTASKNKEKQIEDFINELPQDLKHKLEIKLVRSKPPSPEWLATSEESHKLFDKYQRIVHDDKPQSFSHFKNFLVKSPLLEEHSESGPPCGYGSFHQQYWLDGKLIAVGVIDILPKCVSSVYFYYDPHYRNLTLGTYGALKEIEFTRQLYAACPELKYYYMGFYIHSCRKMRYKGNFTPSDLLCPETYNWFPIKDCIPKLEISPYSRFDPDLDSVDDNFPKETELNYIPVLSNGRVQLYKTFRRTTSKKSEDLDEVREYARLVGAKCMKSLILYRE